MNQDYSFGRWIRSRRQVLNLTQEALAEQVGYSAAMIRKIENDERRPSARGAALLATALEIPETEQDAFMKVARQERSIDHLGSIEEDEVFPWQTAPRPPTNLPLPATLFVGREEALARLADLLQDPACRLITLVGPAGMGKTRLAMQAAQDHLKRFEHGVFFVSLAPLVSAETILGTIANAVGFQFHGAAEPQEHLLRYLQEKRVLLVLDNFEHLMAAVDLLPAILQAAPGVRLLVTSRERLNLRGEWVFEVEGLSYPEDTDERSLDEMEAYGAVQLFLQGALRVHPGFNLDEENREWIACICRLTEGNALGLELAAAWVRVLSCQQIAREIESNLDFLRASAHDVPERHRSLRAALDHSWKLLSEKEKAAFRRLSVFRGGFHREAALEVAGAGLEKLASLLDKSMLKRVGEERYDLHELVRQYAAEHLESDAQDHTQTHDRHSNYYARLLEQWGGQIRSPGQMEILAEMDAEIDNVRLAWSWMVAHWQTMNIQKSLHCLWRFNEIRGWLQEGAALLGQASAALRAADEAGAEQEAERSILLGQVLAQQGYFCAHLGRYGEAGELLQHSLALLRPGADQAALAYTLKRLAYLEYRLGEFTKACQYGRESLALNRALGNQVEVVYNLAFLSYIYRAQHEYEKAFQLSSESLKICRDIPAGPTVTSYCLTAISAAANCLGRYAEAKHWAEESLAISEVLGERAGIGQTLRQLGLISLELGEISRGEALFRQSISAFKEIGDRTQMATTLVELAALTRASGTDSESKQYFLEALQTALDTRTVVIVLQVLIEIAVMEVERGATELALELVTHCLQHPSINRKVRERAELLYTELASQLTPQQVQAVEARAQAKTLEDLAQEILAAND